jgi:hypothetical protein
MINTKIPEISFVVGETELDVIALNILWFKDRNSWSILSKKYSAFLDLKHWDENKVENILQAVYRQYVTELTHAQRKFVTVWDDIQDYWFKFLNDFFNFENGLPNTIFRAHLGISPVFPRKIKKEMFLINFGASDREVKIICAHETSHFYFYRKTIEWIKKSRIFQDDIVDSKLAWLLSEILVPLLLNDKKVYCIFGNIPLKSYACKTSLIKKYTVLYERRAKKEISIENFLEYFFQLPIYEEDVNLNLLK